jgi:dTDP-4-dehydrorhamnose reductase
MSGSLLLIGGDSEIGAAVGESLRRKGHAVAATTRRPERVAADRGLLDLTLPINDWTPPQNTRAACICAAIARLGDCANDQVASTLVNVTHTIALANKLLSLGIPVLFLSTDKVFDGTRACVPAETPPCPVSEYGRQKAAVEAALGERMASGEPVAVLRLAKVISPGMPLLRQWATNLAAGTPVRAFFDMMMAPTPIEFVCEAIAHLLCERTSGIFQLSGPRDVSYSDVAGWLVHALDADASLLQPVSAHSIGLPVGSIVPNTTLESTALRDRFGIAVPDAWGVIGAVIQSCR